MPVQVNRALGNSSSRVIGSLAVSACKGYTSYNQHRFAAVTIRQRKLLFQYGSNRRVSESLVLVVSQIELFEIVEIDAKVVCMFEVTQLHLCINKLARSLLLGKWLFSMTLSTWNTR
jgi:hypothetical protein